VHTHKIDHKGYIHHASPDVPQYEIKSAKTDHLLSTMAVPVGNLIWLAVDRESGDAVVQ
jgi:hypothetical protein